MAANTISNASSSQAIGPRRIAALTAAAELQVDEEELEFESEAERLLWESLQEEFQAFVAKIGPVWIAEG